MKIDPEKLYNGLHEVQYGDNEDRLVVCELKDHPIGNKQPVSMFFSGGVGTVQVVTSFTIG